MTQLVSPVPEKLYQLDRDFKLKFISFNDVRDEFVFLNLITGQTIEVKRDDWFAENFQRKIVVC